MSLMRRIRSTALVLPLVAAACAPAGPATDLATRLATPEMAATSSPATAAEVAAPTGATAPTTAEAAATPALGGPAAGSYAAALPAADAGARLLTLALTPDGAATLTTVFLGKGTVVESGKWSQAGETVAVTLTDTDGAPAAAPTQLEFAVEDGNLANKLWDRQLYGETGLGTLLKQP